MKKMKIVLLALGLILINFKSTAKTIGNQTSGVPTITITNLEVETFFQQQLATYGVTQVSLTNMKIIHDVNDPIDLPFIEFEFTTFDGSKSIEHHLITYLNYNPITNIYDTDYNPLRQEGGGITCSRENCKGCIPTRADKQSPWHCSQCSPILVDQTPKCTQGAGNPPSNPTWIGALAAGLAGLVTAIATIW